LGLKGFVVVVAIYGRSFATEFNDILGHEVSLDWQHMLRSHIITLLAPYGHGKLFLQALFVHLSTYKPNLHCN